NYEYSKIMLHHALEHRIPFMYASSASVYGDGAQGFREEPACEEALNVYAYSKLQFDRYVRQLLPAASSQVVGLRYFNVFGPQENHKGRMASVAFHFHNQLLENGVIKLFAGTDGYADGEQRRDFIYVKDVVRVNLHFWQNPQLSGVFNCGTGTAHSFNDVARALIAHYGKGSIEYIPFPEALKGKYQSFTESDASQLRQAGFTADFTPLTAAVADYAGILDTKGGYV
ncbi:MAG: ADP-glyceromanno-heptose 6-epimerase, partial [Anaeromusa sp.]|uniref:ADP-glyceromanno-heptose 6-epimerase n=1 Tax=Anaeromusa sp. TaxID=1872520 RepID=UPI002B1EF1AF